MEPRYLAFLLLLLVGLASVYAGISGILGYRRQSYIFPHYYSGGINYASVPGGIMCLLWAFAVIVPLPELWANIIAILAIGFGLLGLLFNFIQPAFLTPKWYRWLKENHGDIMPWLRQDVRRMGYDKWKKRTKTIAELEEWATEVRRRYRWEIETIKRQEGTAL